MARKGSRSGSSMLCIFGESRNSLISLFPFFAAMLMFFTGVMCGPVMRYERIWGTHSVPVSHLRDANVGLHGDMSRLTETVSNLSTMVAQLTEHRIKEHTQHITPSSELEHHSDKSLAQAISSASAKLNESPPRDTSPPRNQTSIPTSPTGSAAAVAIAPSSTSIYSPPSKSHCEGTAAKYIPLCEESGNCESLRIHKHRRLSEHNLRKGAIPRKTRERLITKHLRIRLVHEWMPLAGFYTYPMYVLNQLHFAERLGLIGSKKPFVYMPENHHYFNTSKCEPNFWEKWFEPITSADYKTIETTEVWEFAQQTIMSMHHDIDAIHSYPYQLDGETLRSNTGTQDWIGANRALALKNMRKYIRVKKHLVDHATSVFQEYFGANRSSASTVIGVHIRGTDKWITPVVRPEKYFGEIDWHLQRHPGAKIFLATDDPRFITMLRERYGSSLVVRDVARSTTNVFYGNTVSGDKKVLDVLIDALVLSMSHTIVKSWSAVPEFALYFHGVYYKGVPLRVIDLQLNGTSSASQSELTSPSPFIPVLPLEISCGRPPKGCSQKVAPKIGSKAALSVIMNNECTRACTQYRLCTMGVGGAKNTRALNNGLPVAGPNKTVVLVVARWREDTAWLREQPMCYMIMEKLGNDRAIGSDPSVVVVNKGNEASSFLKFIVLNYDNMPDNVIMTHGHRKSKHNVDLVPLLRSLNLDSYPYASLNGINFPFVAESGYWEILKLIQDVLEDVASFPAWPKTFFGVSSACCAQFMVAKKMITRRPLKLWKKLYEYSCGGDPVTDASLPGIPNPNYSWERGRRLELSWHVLMGEPWRSREIDPIKLCGSKAICPQDLPVVAPRSSEYGVTTPHDRWWVNAMKFHSFLKRQERDYPGAAAILGERESNFTLVTTPIQLEILQDMERYEKEVGRPTMRKFADDEELPEGQFSLDTGILDSKEIREFSQLTVKDTFDKDYINILLYNDDPCGVDLFGLRAEPFITVSGFGEHAIRLYSSLHRDMIKVVDVVLVSQGWSQRVQGATTPSIVDDPRISYYQPPALKPEGKNGTNGTWKGKIEGQIWAACSLENEVTYPTTSAEMSKKRDHIDLVISANPKADVGITFYSHFYLGDHVKSHLRRMKPLAFEDKVKKIIVMQAACHDNKFDWRSSWIKELISELTPKYYDSTGRCWTNANATVPWIDKGLANRPMAFHANKRANIRPYMFTLCHESINSTSWVTEKVYHALAVGSVPVFRGSSEILKYLPCSNCIIDANQFTTVKDLGRHLQYLIHNKTAYQELLQWKNTAYDPKDYPFFDNHVRGKSIDTALCRLAAIAAEKQGAKSFEFNCTQSSFKDVTAFQRMAPHG